MGAVTGRVRATGWLVVAVLAGCDLILGSDPNAPVNLQAAVAATGVRLTWTDAASPPRNESGVRVERAVLPLLSFGEIGTVGADLGEYLDTAGLVAGVIYAYRVSAFNASGDSGYSNQATVVSADTPAQPAAADHGNVSGAGTLNGGSGRVIIRGNLTVATYNATTDVTELEGDLNVATLPLGAGSMSFTNDLGTHSVISNSNLFTRIDVNAPGKVLRFAAGQVQTVVSQIAIDGSPSAPIALLSSTDGIPWTIDNQTGGAAVSFVVVRDSNVASNDISASPAISGGNNDTVTPGWMFQ